MIMRITTFDATILWSCLFFFALGEGGRRVGDWFLFALGVGGWRVPAGNYFAP